MPHTSPPISKQHKQTAATSAKKARQQPHPHVLVPPCSCPASPPCMQCNERWAALPTPTRRQQFHVSGARNHRGLRHRPHRRQCAGHRTGVESGRQGLSAARQGRERRVEQGLGRGGGL
eukprot:356293-Chlamydomonas_euryale.AAC.2